MSPPSDEEIDLPDDLLGDADEVPVPHALAKAGQQSSEKPAQPESRTAVSPVQAASPEEPLTTNDNARKPFWRRRGKKEKEARSELSDGYFSAKALQETWIPILVAAMAILLVFASGVVFGIVLTRTAVMQSAQGLLPAKAWLPVLALAEQGGAPALLAPLVAPAGVVLFLLASLYAFLRSRASETSQAIWALLGWILLALFVAGIL